MKGRAPLLVFLVTCETTWHQFLYNWLPPTPHLGREDFFQALPAVCCTWWSITPGPCFRDARSPYPLKHWCLFLTPAPSSVLWLTGLQGAAQHRQTHSWSQIHEWPCLHLEEPNNWLIGLLSACLCAQSCPTLCDSRLLHLRDYPQKNMGVGCPFLLQGNLPRDQPCVSWCYCTVRTILYCWAIWADLCCQY